MLKVLEMRGKRIAKQEQMETWKTLHNTAQRTRPHLYYSMFIK